MSSRKEYAATIDDTVERDAVVEHNGEGDTVRVAINGGEQLIVRLGPWQGTLRRIAWINGQRVTFAWERKQGAQELWINGTVYRVELVDAMTKKLRSLKAANAGTTELKLRAPMPGVVVSVHVEPGQTVASGDRLLVLEAMKMQNELRADRDGVVREIVVKPGDSVQKGAPLGVIAPPSDA